MDRLLPSSKRTYIHTYRVWIFVSLFAVIGILLYLQSSATNINSDINGDNTVDITDLSLLLSSYNQSTSQCVTNIAYKCDLSEPPDGIINIFDLSTLLSNYGLSSVPIGTVTQYTDPNLQLGLAFGDRSHYMQPWRAYSETVAASKLRDAIGINFNVSADQAPAVARLLKSAGFTKARVEIGWDAINYDNPSTLNNATSMQARINALKDNGIRPLILLNSNHGAPNPLKNIDIVVTQAAAAGATSVKISTSDIGQLIPFKSGFRDLTTQKAPEVFFTSISADGTVTLSKPLPTAVDVGTHKAVLVKYEPFQHPLTSSGGVNPKFEDTMAGWIYYTKTVTNTVKGWLGNQNFDVEIWNELTFGADYLDYNNYYSGSPDNGQGDVTNEIPKRTIQALRDSSSGVSNIGITNGFESQRPWGSGANQPPGLTALSKHLYKGAVRFPAQAVYNDIKPKNALNQYAYSQPLPGLYYDTFTPAYDAYFPEYYLNAIQTETLIRDLSPFTTNVGTTPHGRTTSPDGGITVPKIWMTEWNMDPLSADFTNPATGLSLNNFTVPDAVHMQAKSLLRFLASFINKGLDRVYFYAVNDQGFSVVQPDFFNSLQSSGGVYPGDNAGGESVNAVRRLWEATADSTAITSPKTLNLDSIDDFSGNKQFEGNGSAGFPPLNNRDTLAFFPYQLKDTKFMVPAYIMTRNVLNVYDRNAPSSDKTRFDLPDEYYRLTISGTNFSNATVTANDPLSNASVPVNIINKTSAQLVVQLSLTDSPRLLMIDTH
jgi:hypothetical protein